MGAAESFDVQVAYALPERQRLINVRVAAGTSVGEAIRQSGVLTEFPEIVLAEAKLGIFGRRVDVSTSARPGDRIEIYRPLTADPKVVRRERAGRSKNTVSR